MQTFLPFQGIFLKAVVCQLLYVGLKVCGETSPATIMLGSVEW